MSSGSFLDQYLLFQALGWEWNIWNILLFDGLTLLIIFIVIVCVAYILR